MGKFSETHAKSIRDILVDYDKIKVPMYQRNYSWKSGDTDPVTILWNDLYDKFDTLRKYQHASQLARISGQPRIPTNETGEYLLGPMVMITDLPDNEPVQIVDGQQRLATLTMIFCIARDIIYELNYGNIASDPNFIPPQLSELTDLIETSETDVTTGQPIFGNWKLELNEADQKLYRELIQEYRSPGPREHKFLDNPNDLYYKISKKIAWADGESTGTSASSPPKDYSDSEILIMKAYVKLYRNINDALIVNFENNLDTESEKNEINKKIATQVESNFKTNPRQYGFETTFFTDGVEGKKALEEQSWPASEDKAKIVEEFDKKKAINKKTLTTKTRKAIKKNEPGLSDAEYDKKVIDALKLRAPTEIDFPTFIQKKLSDKLKEKDASNKSYNMKFAEHELDLKNQKYLTIKTDNLVLLATFVKSCVSRLMSSVRVEVRDEEDAYEIFETLNGKGQSLSQNNLIKNWIIKKINEPERKTQSEDWDRIVKSITNFDVDKFLMNSLKSRGFQENIGSPYIFGEFPILKSTTHIKLTKKNFYKIIKRRIQNHADATQYMIDLDQDASIFNSFINPTKFPDVASHNRHQRRDPLPAIMDMAYLKAEYIQTILLTAYREWGPTSDSFIILAKFLVPFFFRYKTVSDLGPSTLERIQIETCSAIQNGAEADVVITLRNIIKYILQYNEEIIFSNQLITRFEPPSGEHAKFVLHHIEHFLTPTLARYFYDPDLEVEHILPEKPLLKDPKPEKTWDGEKFFENYDYDKHKIIKKFTKWIPKLGNLTLLGSPANKHVSHFSFIIKRNMIKKLGGVDTPVGYNSSTLKLNEETVMKTQDSDVDRDTWTTESILERGKYLHEQCEKIWKLPEIFCTNIDCLNNTRPTRLNGKLETMSDQKCAEKIDGNICDHEFEIRYPNNCGDEYKVPDAYLTFAPDAPESISIKISDATTAPFEVVVTWTKPGYDGGGTLRGYEIFRDGASVGKVGLDTTFTDTVLNAGTFAYTVKAISNHGTSVDSSVDSITVE